MGKLNLKVGDYIKLREGISLSNMTQGKAYEVVDVKTGIFWFYNDSGVRDWYITTTDFELAEDYILKQIWG